MVREQKCISEVQLCNAVPHRHNFIIVQTELNHKQPPSITAKLQI